MSTSYPVAIDTLTNPVTTDNVNSPSHASQHANVNDAIKAIEAYLGTNASLTAPGASGRVLRSTSATASNWAQLVLTTDVTGVLPVANGGTNASSASITAFNNITGYTAIGATGTTSTNLVFSTSPVLTTPTFVTSITGPLLIGGTTTTSPLTLRSTSGVGTTGADIIFQVGNNGGTEAARFINAGNVLGLKQPSPHAWDSAMTVIEMPGGNSLHSFSSANIYLTSNAYYDGAWKYHATNPASQIVCSNDGITYFNHAVSGSANAALTWVESMRILNSGNVGIGTTNPLSLFHISSNASGTTAILGNYNSAPDNRLQFNTGRGTLGSPTQIQSGDLLGRIDVLGIDNTPTLRRTSRIDFVADGNITSTSAPGRIEFYNTPSGSLTNTIYALLSNAGAWRWHAYGAGTLTTDASGNITAVSDERMKDIQGKFHAGLNEILKIDPILYRYNKQSDLDTDHVYAGFSAQNVMQYIPEAVGTDAKGFYTFNDRPIIAALVNTVKELYAKITQLEQKLLTI